jgi:putative acetyltransferase
MKAAVHLYQKFGYQSLQAPLGNTGHFACNVWMLKQL